MKVNPRAQGLGAAAVFAAIAAWSAAAAQTDVSALLKAEGSANNICRGSDGPDAPAACARRDRLDKALEAKGWCYGQYAKSGADSVWAKCEDPDRAYTSCLSAQARRAGLTSLDGGKSALTLMGLCEPQWKAWTDQCIRRGGRDGVCTLRSSLVAQTALKLSGR